MPNTPSGGRHTGGWHLRLGVRAESASSHRTSPSSEHVRHHHLTHLGPHQTAQIAQSGIAAATGRDSRSKSGLGERATPAVTSIPLISCRSAAAPTRRALRSRGAPRTRRSRSCRSRPPRRRGGGRRTPRRRAFLLQHPPAASAVPPIPPKPRGPIPFEAEVAERETKCSEKKSFITVPSRISKVPPTTPGSRIQARIMAKPFGLSRLCMATSIAK